MQPLDSPFFRRPALPQAASAPPDVRLSQARQELGRWVGEIAIRHRLSDLEVSRLLVDELGDWMKQAQG